MKKKIFEFYGEVTISISTKIKANTLKEAKEILEDREDYFERIRFNVDESKRFDAWGYDEIDGTAKNVKLRDTYDNDEDD